MSQNFVSTTNFNAVLYTNNDYCQRSKIFSEKIAWNKLEEMFTKYVKSVLHLILNKALTLPKKTYNIVFEPKWKDAESGKGATSMNFKYLQRIYFSFINSNNNYANIPWASANKTKLK